MADMKDNPFFKIGALMGETNNKNIALQATIEAQEAEIKRLKTALANISGRGGYMPTTDYKKETELMRKIAQAALKGE